MCTINSPTRSSNEFEETKRLLIAFRDGLFLSAELLLGLKSSALINFDSEPNYRSIISEDLFHEFDIVVDNHHLRNMLMKYITGKISESELSDWATIIFASSAFTPAGDTETEREEAGDGILWDLLQRLTSPSVFDGLDQEIAQTYLHLLDDVTAADTKQTC